MAAPAPRPVLTVRLARLRRRALRYRRWVAAVLAALAVYAGLRAATTPPAAPVPTWVAAHDLSSGAVLGAGDLRRAGFAPGTVPRGAIADPSAVLGRTLAAPLPAGMPVLRDAVVSDRWLGRRGGVSAVPVRVSDPAVAPLLAVGDRVDLVGVDPDHPDAADTAVPIVTDATVLAIPAVGPDGGGTAPAGRLVIFGVPPASAARIATFTAGRFVTVVWNH